jgi:hypothetical protein
VRVGAVAEIDLRCRGVLCRPRLVDPLGGKHERVVDGEALAVRPVIA